MNNLQFIYNAPVSTGHIFQINDAPILNINSCGVYLGSNLLSTNVLGYFYTDFRFICNTVMGVWSNIFNIIGCKSNFNKNDDTIGSKLSFSKSIALGSVSQCAHIFYKMRTWNFTVTDSLWIVEN